jgi:hypothetical protein
MAAGDIANFGPTSTADAAFLALQPSAGVEVVIHNIGYAGAMELYYYDGTNQVLVDTDATAGSRLGLFLHCTNAKYYRIKNISGGTVYLCADGMTTK